MSLNVCVIVDDLYMYAVTAAAVEIIGKENPTTKELETMQIKEKKKIKNIIFYISNQFCNIFVLYSAHTDHISIKGLSLEMNTNIRNSLINTNTRKCLQLIVAVLWKLNNPTSDFLPKRIMITNENAQPFINDVYELSKKENKLTFPEDKWFIDKDSRNRLENLAVTLRQVHYYII